VRGDHVAVLGSNRKLLIFPLTELPEMARGTGIKLQSYTDAHLIDVATFSLEEGLTVPSGDRSRSFTKAELKDWMSERAKSGRVTPNGFPRAGRLR
jgi:topoisomerase IV subunit A